MKFSSLVLKNLSFLLIFIFGLSACQSENKTTDSFTLNIRIPKDPEKLNPVFNPKLLAREIFQYIFVPLADYSPDKLALTPILIESIPEVNKDKQGNFVFEYEFKQEAVWDDGKPITGFDYEFTIKTVLHPLTETSSWRSILKNIVDVKVNHENPKKFTVVVNGQYMLALEAASTIYVLPKHIYDQNNYCSNFSIQELLNEEWTNATQDSSYINFSKEFNNPDNYRKNLHNCGPYYLDKWISQEYLTLKKKDNYWANESSNFALQANPTQINFQIIPDEIGAITAFKDGNIDFIHGLSADNFSDLKESSTNHQYLTSEIMKYYYISINHQDAKLKDVDVRKALSHLVDLDGIIDAVENGDGTPTIGHIHPSKSYYNKSIIKRELNVEKAKNILMEDGWFDTNDNGILDKEINGIREELDLDILITGSELGKKIALIIQNSAKEAGVKITIISKKFRNILNEDLRTFKYELAALAVSSDAAPDDPYSRWHSDAITEGIRNYAAFDDVKNDSLIQLIRTTTNPQERAEIYLEFQQYMHDQQVVLFLYCPMERMILRDGFIGKSTTKRPGYLANTFTLK